MSGPLLSRLAQVQKDLQDENFMPDMPPVEIPHILEYLFEVGPVLSGGMGPAPLNHTELAAWQANTGVELQAWEARMLLQLSRDYLVQMQRSVAADCRAPWAPADLIRRVSASTAMRSAIKEMVNA